MSLETSSPTSVLCQNPPPAPTSLPPHSPPCFVPPEISMHGLQTLALCPLPHTPASMGYGMAREEGSWSISFCTSLVSLWLDHFLPGALSQLLFPAAAVPPGLCSLMGGHGSLRSLDGRSFPIVAICPHFQNSSFPDPPCECASSSSSRTHPDGYKCVTPHRTQTSPTAAYLSTHQTHPHTSSGGTQP